MITVYRKKAPAADSRKFLLTVLKRDYAIAEPEILTEEYGKPYLYGNPVHFNISHSGKYVAIAFSEHPVGLDIQLRSVRSYPAIARRLTAEEKQEDFYALWTAKEAYVKLLGRTVSGMLPSLRYERGTMYENGRPVSATFLFEEQDGHVLCVCTETADTVRFINE